MIWEMSEGSTSSFLLLTYKYKINNKYKCENARFSSISLHRSYSLILGPIRRHGEGALEVLYLPAKPRQEV